MPYVLRSGCCGLWRLPLFQVHRFENCVFTEFFSDGKHRLLQLSLTLQVSSVGFLFLFFCCIICEKIELGKAVFLLQSSVLRDNVVGDNIQPADQERRIDKTIEKIDGGVHDPVGRGGIVVQILGSMRLLWNRAAVAVCFDGTVVGGSPGGIGQVFDIVADGEDNLVGYDFLFTRSRASWSAISFKTSFALSVSYGQYRTCPELMLLVSGL